MDQPVDFLEPLKRLWARPANPEELSISTRALLAQLETVDWFSNAGMPMDAGPDVQPVSGWTEAIEVCSSQRSEDARLEAQNELTVQLHTGHREAYQAWNSKVQALKPYVVKLIQTKFATPAARARIPSGAEQILVVPVRWELLGLCMSHEYEDLVPISKYYELVEQLYLASRFPCGWVGEVPDNMAEAFEIGKLAVL